MKTVGAVALRSRESTAQFSNRFPNTGRPVRSNSRRRAHAEPGSEFKLPGRFERLVGRNGEINASNKRDLTNNIVQLVQAASDGQVALDNDIRSRENLARMQDFMIEAYYDDDSRNWSAFGAQIAGELADTADREGFMRRLLLRVELANGSIPRIRVRYKNILAVVASSASMVYATMIRNKYLLPAEFYINSHIWIEEREIAQGTGDIMEEKFFDSQESIMVKEDTVWLNLANKTVGLSNPLQILAGGLTPQTLQAMKNQVTQWNLPVTTCLFSSDIWNYIATSTTFGAWFDPVSKFELVMTGVVGELLGMRLISDAYRHPTLKVLPQGTVFVLSSPQLHGAYTDRGPVSSREIDAAAAAQGVPARGWFMSELMSQVISNPRSIVKGLVQSFAIAAVGLAGAVSLLAGLPGTI